MRQIGWFGAQAKESDEVDNLLRELRPRIYRLALAMCASVESAEDIVQEVSLRLIRSRRKLPHLQDPWAWTRRITIRCVLDSRSVAPCPLPQDLIARCSDPDETLRVAATLATLSPDHRVILALAIFEGLSYEEMSEALNIPVGSVGSRLNQARERFRTLWEKD